ncbi:MAG: hypothetical protein IPO23_06785 [Flavobacterium sp.]|nr:hypothetical protein [Flavobacterium sp.]
MKFSTKNGSFGKREVQHREKVVEEEVNPGGSSAPRREGGFSERAPRTGDFRVELQDVQRGSSDRPRERRPRKN